MKILNQKPQKKKTQPIINKPLHNHNNKQKSQFQKVTMKINNHNNHNNLKILKMKKMNQKKKSLKKLLSEEIKKNKTKQNKK
jgi:hypothetical protein